jgi:hypothetical protein
VHLVPQAPAAEVPAQAAGLHRAETFRTIMRALVVLGVLGVSACLVGAGSVALLMGLGFFTWDDLRAGRIALKSPRSSEYQTFWGNARDLAGKDEKAFKLMLARDIWVPDKELKTHFVALGAWMNKQDDAWLAIAVKDYGTQKPRDAELLQQAIDKLEAHFGESLELGARAEAADFAGVKAQRLAFKGRTGAVLWSGACTMLSHHGFGYWVFVAGPGADDVRRTEAALKKEETGFSLVTDRAGWREQPTKLETFTSSDGLVSVTAAEGVWEKSTPANVEFETGTLLLLGRYQKEKDNQKNAHLQVFTLDGQTELKEALKGARDYLEKQKQEQNSGYKLGPMPDAEGQSELGVVDDVGNRRGRIAELTLSLGDSPARYYLLAVVSEPERVNVVLCDCMWKSRQIWRQDFLDLLKTMKAKTKAVSSP